MQGVSAGGTGVSFGQSTLSYVLDIRPVYMSSWNFWAEG